MSWPLVKLGEVAPSKPIRAKGYGADDLVWQITLDHVEANTGVLLEKNIRPYSEAGSSTHGFDNRYVLYSKLRPYLNKVLLPDEEGICTTELVPMLPNQKTLDRNYLAHYLKSREFVNWISAQTAGAKMPRVSMDVFWNHEIPLPPLEEQKRIAAILDKADAVRRKRQKAIKLADDFLRSVFLEMFGDPVTNPNGWEIVDIEDVCSDIVDCINKTAKSVDYETPYKMIRTTNVRDMKVDLTNVRYVDKDVYEKWISRLRPEVGDIVFTREAPAGEAGIIDFDDLVLLGQRTMQFRPDKNRITSSFLLHEMMGAGIKAQMEKMSSGSTVKHLSVPECKKFKVRKPPIDLQVKFDQIRIQTLSILKLENQAGRTSLFESLSQKAFSGDLQV